MPKPRRILKARRVSRRSFDHVVSGELRKIRADRRVDRAQIERSRLYRLYGSHAAYVAAVARSVSRSELERLRLAVGPRPRVVAVARACLVSMAAFARAA